MQRLHSPLAVVGVGDVIAETDAYVACKCAEGGDFCLIEADCLLVIAEGQRNPFGGSGIAGVVGGVLDGELVLGGGVGVEEGLLYIQGAVANGGGRDGGRNEPIVSGGLGTIVQHIVLVGAPSGVFPAGTAVERHRIDILDGAELLHVVGSAEHELVCFIVDAENANQVAGTIGHKSLAEVGVVGGADDQVGKGLAVDALDSTRGDSGLHRPGLTDSGVGETAVADAHQTADVAVVDAGRRSDIDRLDGLRKTVLGEVLVKEVAVDASDRTVVDPTYLIDAVVVADDEPLTVDIDRLSDGIGVAKPRLVDLDLDGSGFVLHHHAFVEVAALIGTDDGGAHDEGLPGMADGVHPAGGGIDVDDVADGLVGLGTVVRGHDEFRLLPFVAGGGDEGGDYQDREKTLFHDDVFLWLAGGDAHEFHIGNAPVGAVGIVVVEGDAEVGVGGDLGGQGGQFVAGGPLRNVEVAAGESGGVADRHAVGGGLVFDVLNIHIDIVVAGEVAEGGRDDPTVDVVRAGVLDGEGLACSVVEPALIALNGPTLRGERVGGEIDGVESLGVDGRGDVDILDGADNELHGGVVDGENADDVAGAFRQQRVGKVGVTAGAQHDGGLILQDDVPGGVGAGVAVVECAAVAEVAALDLDQAVVHALVDLLGGGDDDRFRLIAADAIAEDVQVFLGGGNAGHGAIHPETKLFVLVVVADLEVAALDIDALADAVFGIEGAVVDLDHDGAGLILDGEVLVAVAGLVGGGDDAGDDGAVGNLRIRVGGADRVQVAQFGDGHVGLPVESEHGGLVEFPFAGGRDERQQQDHRQRLQDVYCSHVVCFYKISVKKEFFSSHDLHDLPGFRSKNLTNKHLSTTHNPLSTNGKVKIFSLKSNVFFSFEDFFNQEREMPVILKKNHIFAD